MQFSGTLYTYYKPKKLTAFASDPVDASKVVVYVGGLTDGYNSVPFLEPLQAALADIGWSLIQVQLSSSYTGYGIVNLQTDSDELDHLVRYLKEEKKKKTIVLLGHSTGSQDCYWHNKNGKMNAAVAGYILQAPVSDRESTYAHDPRAAEWVSLASAMRADGRGAELMPRAIGHVPTTADRYFSLNAFGGDDDVFSTDLPDDMIERLYKDVHRPMAWVHAKDDEHWVTTNDQMDVMKRYQKFCPAIEMIGTVESGGHEIASEEGKHQLVDFVLEFIRKFE
ncbi:hypothetical protein BX666DRAFT_1004486 [Dichotomocladium elegans]|nr:hypothetical protein BX666DRAFT_1004486 [Dichotomocladium elegans]